MNREQLINLVGNMKIEISVIENLLKNDHIDPALLERFKTLSNIISTYEESEKKTLPYAVYVGETLKAKKILSDTDVVGYDIDILNKLQESGYSVMVDKNGQIVNLPPK